MSSAIHFPTDWRFFVRNRRSKNAIMTSNHPDGRVNYVKFDQNDRPQLPLSPKPFLSANAGIPHGTVAVAIYLHSSTRDFFVESENGAATAQQPGKVQKLCDIPLEHLDSPYLDDDKPPSSSGPALHIRIRFESCTGSRVSLLQLQAIPIDAAGNSTSEDRILSAPITYINRSMRKSSQAQGWKNVLALLTSEVPDVWGKFPGENPDATWSAPGEGRPTIRRANNASANNQGPASASSSLADSLAAMSSMHKPSSPSSSSAGTPSGAFKARQLPMAIKGGVSKHRNTHSSAVAIAQLNAAHIYSPTLGLVNDLSSINLSTPAPPPAELADLNLSAASLAFNPATFAPAPAVPAPQQQQQQQQQQHHHSHGHHQAPGRAPIMAAPPVTHPVAPVHHHHQPAPVQPQPAFFPPTAPLPSSALSASFPAPVAQNQMYQPQQPQHVPAPASAQTFFPSQVPARQPSPPMPAAVSHDSHPDTGALNDLLNFDSSGILWDLNTFLGDDSGGGGNSDMPFAG